MITPFNIISNSYEDLGDELASGLTNKYTNIVFKSIRDKLDLQEDSIFDEAISSALTTLQFGIMQSVVMVVAEYVIPKTALIFGILISYIKGRSFVKKGKSVAQNIFQKIGTKGGFVGKAIQGAFGAVLGSQEQALAMAKIANDSTNNIISNVSQERQNQILLSTQKIQRVESTKSQIFSVRNKAQEKNMSLFVWKTTNGLWEKTDKDEKLYKNCVGDITVPFNADFVKKLNSLADVVKTAKGEIISRAKAEIDMITAIGATVKG